MALNSSHTLTLCSCSCSVSWYCEILMKSCILSAHRWNSPPTFLLPSSCQPQVEHPSSYRLHPPSQGVPGSPKPPSSLGDTPRNRRFPLRRPPSNPPWNLFDGDTVKKDALKPIHRDRARPQSRYRPTRTPQSPIPMASFTSGPMSSATTSLPFCWAPGTRRGRQAARPRANEVTRPMVFCHSSCLETC